MRATIFIAVVLFLLSISNGAYAEIIDVDKADINTERVASACQAIGEKLSSVKEQECLDFSFEALPYSSVNHQPILIKEFPPLGNKLSQARVLLIGGTHGDELTSISVVFKWLAILQKHHSGLFHWRITPLMNPDGALQKKHSRTNANGVDLNRNFPSAETEMSAHRYWIEKTYKNTRRFPGDFPLSEPESQWLHNEIKTFKPDIIVSLHAPYKLVDFDAPSRKNAPKRIGRLYKNLMGTYPGSLGNYGGIQKGIPVITIELPHAGIMPTKHQISRYWADLVKWLIVNTKEDGNGLTIR